MTGVRKYKRRKKKKERKKNGSVDVSMVRCKVTSIWDGCVIMRPLVGGLGIEGSITYKLRKDEKPPQKFSEVSAFNVYGIKDFRAKKITF